MLEKLVGSLKVKSRLGKLRGSRCPDVQVDPSHLLVIAWTFPPLFATSVHSPFSLARDALSRFDKVSVLCGNAHERHWPSSGDTNHKILDQLNIVRADLSGFPKFSSKLVSQIDGGLDTAITMTEVGIREFSERPPGVIFVSGPRFSNFATATLLTHYFHALPKVFLHYQDEWNVKTPSFIRTSIADQAWEADAIRTADGLIFVTEGKMEAYLNSDFNLSDKPLMVCGLGWDNAGTDYLPTGLKNSKFVISFVGNSGPQSPLDPFLELYWKSVLAFPDRFAGTVLRITGRQPEAITSLVNQINEAIPGLIELLPPVSPEEALMQIRSSDALLLLANTSYKGVIPLKTFEYMSSDIPVLVYDTISQAADIVQSTGAGEVIAAQDHEALSSAVELMMSTDKSRWQTSERSIWKEHNRRDRLNARMLDFIISGTAHADHPLQIVKCLTGKADMDISQDTA